MPQTRICFIINPVAGGKHKEFVKTLLDQILDKEKFDMACRFTTHKGHARSLAQDAINEGFQIIGAVGGDGTINEIAHVVTANRKMLAVIPFGSGNGLARFLNIPIDPVTAIKAINGMRSQFIDSATLNGIPFFNMAGIGFDAHISKEFSLNKRRGLSSYVRIVVNEFSAYNAAFYKISLDGLLVEQKAFFVSIANSSQYGNNFHIAPLASITDGLLDVCIVKPFRWYNVPFIIANMLLKRSGKNRITIIKAKNIEIELKGPAVVHLDGEPVDIGHRISVQVIPLSLEVIVP